MFNTYEHNGMFPVVLIVWDVSTTSHSTVGRDGHLGLEYCAWDSLGFPQCVHYFPRYSGMGWDGHCWDSLSVSILTHSIVGWNGHRWDSTSVSTLTHSTVGWNGHHWDSPSVSILTHSTVGWNGMDIIGIPPVCPLLPTV